MKFLKILTLTSLTSLLLTSCVGSRGMRAQEVKADLALREMRSKIEDFKYQLNKYEVELQIVESKVDSQNTSLNQVRQDVSKLNKNDQNFVESTFALYDKKIERLESIEQTLRKDLIQLKERTNEVLSSLAQFKTKIDANENQMLDQKRSMEHVKASLDALMKHVQEPKGEEGYYVVSAGDSLERIAKENGTSVEKLKDLNHITGDLIVVGQKMRLK